MSLLSPRGMGHKPNGQTNVRTFGNLTSASFRPIPECFSIHHFLDLIRDQGDTESCVGHAIAEAAYVRARVLGFNPTFPSPLAAYSMARIYDKTSNEPLVDLGSRPAMAALALHEMGFVPESQWPLVDENINQMLPLDVLQTGIKHRLTDYRLLDGAGPARSEGIRAALAAGYPVCLSISVDDEFTNTNGFTPIDELNGKVRGAHYVCALGYTPDSILIANSWGLDWGNVGYGWLSNARIEDTSTTDVMAMVSVERQ